MPKKTPQRMCVGCREMKSKRELIRVVRTPADGLKIDGTGKMAGRGAYICPTEACLAKALKSKALERSLNAPLGEEVSAYLQEQLAVAKATALAGKEKVAPSDDTNK